MFYLEINLIIKKNLNTNLHLFCYIFALFALIFKQATRFNYVIFFICLSFVK